MTPAARRAAAVIPAPSAAERQRALWRKAQRRRRQRENAGERVVLVRYNAERLNKLVAGGYLVAEADKDPTEIGLAVEKLIDHVDL